MMTFSYIYIYTHTHTQTHTDVKDGVGPSNFCSCSPVLAASLGMRTTRMK